MRNVGRLVRANDRKEILSQLKPVYQAQDKKRANELLEGFYDRVESNYPKHSSFLFTCADNKLKILKFQGFYSYL